MPYTPYDWADGAAGGTPITAARLDTLEQGLAIATGSTVSVEEYGATGDGTTDDGPALRSAFTAGGDIFMPAGTYRFVATASTPNLPAGTRIRGVPGQTIISLDTSSAGAYREFVANGGDEVIIEGITVTRASDFQCVVFPVRGTTGYTLRNVTIDGRRDLYTTNYCHAFQLGVQNTPATTRFRLLDSKITRCSYGLFQSNASTASPRDIQVVGCSFSANTATDLEFNSPAGQITDIRVERCDFQANTATAASAGFAVGLAHVLGARVRDCTVSTYNNEAIHIEDYSEDVAIVGNSFTSCGLLQGSYVQVISGSRRVRIEGNTFNATSNAVASQYVVNVLAGGTGTTPGGRTVIAPSQVITRSNHFNCGSTIRGLYYEAVPYGTVAENQLFGSGSVATTTYSGGSNIALNLYAGSATVVSGNTAKGFLWGTNVRTDTINAFGTGSTITGNTFHECQLGIAATNSDSAVFTGNMFYKCVSPMILGNAASGPLKSTVVTGNHAYSCALPFSLYGVAHTTTTGTGAVGTATISVAAVPNHLPIGTVILFSGGGSLTTTTLTSVLATSVTGTLSGASVASGETATAYLGYNSSDSTLNRTIAHNGDSYWGASGYGQKTASVSTSYRVLGYEDLVVATASGITLTLPTPAGSRGRLVLVKNTSAGSVTLATAAGNIDSASTATITAGSAARVVSNGTNWLTV